MKHTRYIKIIALIAFLLSIFGFILDLGELDHSRLQNLIDITLMTLIFFGTGMILYGLIVVSNKIFPRIKL
jgi:vacuolar-type H+-ATPase subunit I/STV1